MITHLMRWWLRRRVVAGLDGIYAEGIDPLRAAVQDGPVVLACTHQSWWDGPVVVWLSERLGVRPTIVMDADNLDVLPFFAAFGAIGVRGPSGVRAAMGRLKAPGDVLWVFPQGRYVPAETRPVTLEKGAVWLASQMGCPVFPVALGYRFAEQPRPRAYLAVQPAVSPDREALARSMERGLDRIADGAHTEDFEPLAAGLPLVPDAATRWLAWIWRTFRWMR